MVKTPPFHGDNMGSNPVGVITKKALAMARAFFVILCEVENIWCRGRKEENQKNKNGTHGRPERSEEVLEGVFESRRGHNKKRSRNGVYC